MTATRKPNYKKIDLGAPLWVPQLNEMCEYLTIAGHWARCRIVEIPPMQPDYYHIEFESGGALATAKFVRLKNLREGATPASKLDQLAALMKAGRWEKALALAAKFQDLGEHARAITRGDNAAKRPDFYRQIKQDPGALVAAGIAALKARYCAA